jgi:hypothetical protein
MDDAGEEGGGTRRRGNGEEGQPNSSKKPTAMATNPAIPPMAKPRRTVRIRWLLCAEGGGAGEGAGRGMAVGRETAGGGKEASICFGRSAVAWRVGGGTTATPRL